MCPVCQTRPATTHPILGKLACNVCQNRRKQNALPNVQVEMVGNNIKDQRQEYAKSVIQPYRSGVLSQEYLDNYGTKNIKPTKEEIKNAKPVWKDINRREFDISKTK